MKPLDNGAFVKEYEAQDKETEQAIQMAVTTIASEDPRYVERMPPPLSEEFPIGTKVFFLGEHAYGTASQVSGVTDTALSVILAVSASLPPRMYADLTSSIQVLCARQRRNRKVEEYRLGPSSREVSSFLRSRKDRRTINKSGLKTHLQRHGNGRGPLRKGQPWVECQIRGKGPEGHWLFTKGRSVLGV